MTTTLAPPSPASERARLTLGEVVADSRVLGRRQLRKLLRRPTYVVFALIQPVMFLLLFRFVFGGAIDTGGPAYVDFLLPGVMVQSAVFGALMTGMGLAEDIGAGVVDRLRSLPIARSAVLLGRTGADIVMNVATLLVMFVAGLAVGFRPEGSPLELLLALLLIVGFAYTFSWISGFIGLALKDIETVSSAGLIWVFPLTMLSSAFVPADSMPGPVGAFAEVNPITLAVDATRALTLGQGDALAPALGTVAWLVALLAVFVPLATRAFRTA